MKNKIKVELSQKGIQSLINYLEEYKQSVIDLTNVFCNRLTELGMDIINVKISNVKNLEEAPNHIAITKKVDKTEYGCETILLMKDSSPILRKWSVFLDGEKIEKIAEISPTLMLEFGSGEYASATPNHRNTVNVKEQVGKGTFPSHLTKPIGNENHAKEGIWHWMDEDKKWHWSKGIAPTMPMYSAFLEMEKQIEQIGKEVFE